MKHRRASQHGTGQRGVSMIEVLVSVVVLAIGLLGLAALQATALKNNLAALQRTQASMLGYFMLDAMRADSAEAVNGGYNIGNPAVANNRLCVSPGVAGSLAEWHQQRFFFGMDSAFGATGANCIATACDSDGNCTIRVFWDDSRISGGGAASDFVLRSRL